MKTPVILGPNGRPARESAYFLTPSPRWNQKQYKPRYYLSSDTKVNINPYDRWEAVNYSRQLFAQIPEVGGAIRQKNQYAFGSGWDAHYAGRCTDQAYIEEAEEFLNQVFFPNANLRGGPFADFNHSLKISGYAMDYDGDDVMLCTELESGMPAVAFVTAPRISSKATEMPFHSPTVKDRYPQEGKAGNVIKGGAFNGASVNDGIITDRDGRIAGVRISGDGDKYQDVSLFKADLRCDTEWHDQTRGLPILTRPMLRWMNWQDIQEFLERAVKRVAAQPLTARTKTGDAIQSGLNPIEQTPGSSIGGPNASLVAGGQPGPANQPNTLQVYNEVIEGGELLYLSTDDKEEIVGVDFQVPHENVATFLRETMRGGLFAIGWFLELVNLGDTGRASSRLLCRLGNQSIWGRRLCLYPRWKRAVTYALSIGMERGFIRRCDDDPFAWEPGFPEDLSVDQGNDEQNARENIKMGTSSKHIEAQRSGRGHWKQLDRQRDLEAQALVTRAKALSKFSEGSLTFDAAMQILEQRSPNPIYQEPEDQAVPGPSDDNPQPTRKPQPQRRGK